MNYATIHIVHLLCAVLFIGVVFFEVVILEGVRRRIGDELMPQVEEGIISRAKLVMPWVVATLFLSGIGLTHWHVRGKDWGDLVSSSFHILLGLKILLALSVLIHFITAMRSAQNGCMSSTRFQVTHLSVFVHMLAIVILAKLMFYLSG